MSEPGFGGAAAPRGGAQKAARTGLHLHVEDARLGRIGGAKQQVLLEKLEDVVADGVQLVLHLLLVRGDLVLVVPTLLLLLRADRADDAQRRPARADDGEEVALLEAEVAARARGHVLHVLHHLVIPLSLPKPKVNAPAHA